MLKRVILIIFLSSFSTFALSDSTEWSYKCEKASRCFISSKQTTANPLELFIKKDDEKNLSIHLIGEGLMKISMNTSVIISIDETTKFNGLIIDFSKNLEGFGIKIKINEDQVKSLYRNMQLSRGIRIETSGENNKEFSADFSLKNFTNAYKELFNKKKKYKNYGSSENPLLEKFEGKETFSYSVASFIERYNKSETVESLSEVTMHNKKESPSGGIEYQFKAIKGGEIAIIADEWKNKKMMSALLFATPKSETGRMQLLMGILGMIDASNPKLSIEERKEISSIVDLDKLVDSAFKNEVQMHGITYTVSSVPSLGITTFIVDNDD